MVKKMIEAQEGQVTSVYDTLEHGLNWSAPTMNSKGADFYKVLINGPLLSMKNPRSALFGWAGKSVKQISLSCRNHKG